MSVPEGREPSVGSAQPCGPGTVAWILVGCLPLSLLADSINGILLIYLGAVPVSAVFKMILLFGFLLYLALADAKAFSLAAGVVCLVLALAGVHMLAGESLDAAIGDLQWGLRAALILSAYLAFSRMLQRGEVDGRGMMLAFSVCAGVITVNLAVGLAGIGFAQYDEKFGVAGFFFAGNELAVSIVSIAVVLFVFVLRTGGGWAFAGAVALAVLLATVTLTKVALVGVVALAIAVPASHALVATLVRGRPERKFIRIAWIASSIAATGTAFAAWFIWWTGFLDRASFFLDRVGWVGLLLSGRDVMIQSAWREFSSGAGLREYLVGTGVGWLQGRHGGQTESDFVDFAISFGVPFTVAMFVLLMTVAWMSAKVAIRQFSFYPFAPVIPVYCFALAVVAALAGHVFNSGMAAPLIGATLSLWRCPVFASEEGWWLRYARTT